MSRQSFLFAIALWIFSGSILADILRVDNNHPNADYETIQEAVDAANPFDTIKVGPGEYAGAYIDQPVTIKGSGPDTRIVEANDLAPWFGGDAFTIFGIADGAEIKDLTIDGGENDIRWGVYFFRVHNIRLKNLEFVDVPFSVTGSRSNYAHVSGLRIFGSQQGIRSADGDGWIIKDNTLISVEMAPGPGGANSANMILIVGSGRDNLIKDNLIYHHDTDVNPYDTYAGIALVGVGPMEYNVIKDNDVVMVVEGSILESAAVLLLDYSLMDGGSAVVQYNEVIDNALSGELILFPSTLSDLNIIKEN